MQKLFHRYLILLNGSCVAEQVSQIIAVKTGSSQRQLGAELYSLNGNEKLARVSIVFFVVEMCMTVLTLYRTPYTNSDGKIFCYIQSTMHYNDFFFNFRNVKFPENFVTTSHRETLPLKLLYPYNSPFLIPLYGSYNSTEQTFLNNTIATFKP